MVDLDELDRLHAALPELEAQTQDDGWTAVHLAVICEAPMGPGVDLDMYDAATNAVTLLRAYPALAAEVRALREELANRAVEAFALRGVAAAARCAVLSENLSRDDLRRELDMLRAALAKVPR